MKTLKKNPWYVAAGCFLQMFLGMGLCSSFSMMLPEISAHTGISTGSISGNLTVAYLASFIVSMFFFKPLLRKFGAKKLLIFGDFLLMFHYILYSYAESLWFLRICGMLENIFLRATDLGVGSCWINQARDICDDERVRPLLREFGVPDTHICWGIAILGYPAAEPRTKIHREGTFNIYH